MKPLHQGPVHDAIPGIPRHCDTPLPNSACPYLDMGCLGCTPVSASPTPNFWEMAAVNLAQLRLSLLEKRARPHCLPALPHVPGSEFRAAGDCICPVCGQEYRRHPEDPDQTFLHVLCTGERVKL